MEWKDDELEKYSQYLDFVRRKMIDEIPLPYVKNIMNIEFDDIKKDAGDYIFSATIRMAARSRRKAKLAKDFKTISYDRWKVMLLRDEKLNKLL